MKFLNFASIKKWILEHKKTSIVLALVLVFVGYKVVSGWNNTTGETRYIISTAKIGTITSSVTGTGQVSASNRVDVASEVSGDIVSVPVKLGDIVKKGQTLTFVDSGDTQRAVQNAELSLENAQISYDKALKTSQDQASNSSISDSTFLDKTSTTRFFNLYIGCSVQDSTCFLRTSAIEHGVSSFGPYLCPQ